MTTFDRDAVIKQAAATFKPGWEEAHFQGRIGHRVEGGLSAALPVIVAATLAPIEANHYPVEVEPSDTICGPCSFQLPNGRFFGKVVEWPCPDMQVIADIKAKAGVA